MEVGALLGLVSENGAATASVKEKEEEIKKIEPTSKENNVIKLDASKKEPKIFEEKNEVKKETVEEKPLILTDEVVEKKTSNEKLENTTLNLI